MIFRVSYRSKFWKFKKQKDFNDRNSAEFFMASLENKGIRSIIKKVSTTETIQYEVL